MPNRSFFLIQDSYDRVLPIIEPVAAHFFVKLFELDPALRLHYPTEPEQQTNLVLEMLTDVVENLYRFEPLLPCDQAPKQETVLLALLEAMSAGIGDTFCPETKLAWGKIDSLLDAALNRAVSLCACSVGHDQVSIGACDKELNIQSHETETG